MTAASGAKSVSEDATCPETLRSRLRRETRAAHERLDASFAALAEGDMGSYAAFVRMNETCHRAIGPILAASPLASHRPVAKSPHSAALADLESLGLRRIAPDPFPISQPSLAQSVGIAYVLEGSKLGARLILKRLRNCGRPETDRLLAAFLSEAAEDPEEFKPFLGLAEALVATRSEQDAAVGAANATFDYFYEAARRASTVGEAAVG